MKIYKSLIIFLCLLSLQSIYGITQPNNYQKWKNLPSEDLLRMGNQYSELAERPDSALLCFTIVASRYNKTNSSTEEKRLCSTAFIGKWYVYFFHYFDYSQAYENLSHAQEMAEEIGQNIGRVLLNFGCMYQTISEQSGDLKPDSLALDYYKRSYKQARVERDSISSDMAISNMIVVAYTLGCMDNIGKELNDYKLYGQYSSNYHYNLLLFEGLLALGEGQYAQALSAFEQQEKLISKDKAAIRYFIVTHTNKSRVYAAQGDYRQAIAMMQTADSLATKLNMKDARLEVYSLLDSYYEHLGMQHQADDYHRRYLSLKDSLLSYHQVASVNELRFLGEMKKVDKQMEEMANQQRFQNFVIKSIICLALLILVFTIIVWRKNKQLHHRNEMLYHTNVEMLRKVEEERERHKEFAQQADSLLSSKYKSSTLDDAGKKALFASIVKVMESSDEIFSSEFSGQRLATLVGVRYNYVSQVINERYGGNFNSFLNEYRIMEACKRINDHKRFGHLTIEGIANSVGFKSRTTFIQSFKRHTGLTPSEYLRIARETTEN